MRKRVLSLLTTLALMAGLCTPLGGLVPEAEASGYKTYGVLEYGTVTSTGTPGESDPNGLYQVIRVCDPNATGAIVIPSEIDGLPVKEIGSYAFDGCSGITSVYVPGSVELIGQRAFRDCTSLESVTLCDGLLRIRGYAFEGCTSLTSIVIPSTVESLWSDSLSTTKGHTFLDCTSLREVFILSRNVALESSYALNSMYTPYYSDLFENCAEDLVIYGYAGSTAEEYTGYNWYNLAFSVLDESFEWTPDLPEEENQPTGAIPTPSLNDPTCTEEGVSLSWTLPLEVPGETQTVDGFCILRKTAGGSYQPIDQVVGKYYTHSYVDTSVQEGQTYTYTVQAYYQDKAGDYEQAGKTITFTRPVTIPAVERAEFILDGRLTTDTLWTGEESDIYIYLKEDPGFSSESDPGYVVLTDRDNGKQLWRSDRLYYYSSDNVGSTYRFDFTFDPKDCADGYLPSGRKVQFRVLDDAGKEILAYDCETFPLQLWSFDNPNSTFDQAFLEQFYSKSQAKAVFKAAKADTLGGDGLCVGMSLLVSLINSGGIGDIGFSGCDELGQVQKDTPLTGSMEGYTALDLIKACQARQYFDSIVRQRKENREDLTGLIDAVESYKRGIGAMPVVILSTPQEGASDYVHALAAYAAEEDGQGHMRIDVYDPNHPDFIGSYITIYNYGEEDAFWIYREQFKGGEGEFGIYDESLIDAAFKKYGLTYFTSRGYPMQQEDDIWVSIAGYDFSTLKNSGLEIDVLDSDRFQGLNAAWVSGQGTLNLSGLTGQAEIADGETSYTIDADGGSASLTLKEEVDTVKVTGDGTLTVTCTYQGERGTVTTRFSGRSEDGVTVDRTGDAVRVSGGESGTVTVTYENGKTWTEQVEPGQDLTVSADGENTPSAAGGTSGTAVSSFRDVSSSAYYADAVRWAVEQGITAGTSETTFSPDAPCTRAQVVTFIWRTLGLDELNSRSTDNPFWDVHSSDYYCDAVLWAAENGITAGTSGTTFSPDAPCTRAQVVTFLWRTDFPPKQITGPVGFRDVHVGDYFWFPVKWALEMDITAGTSADTFSPDDTCTRAQVITFLYRYLGEATQA